MNGFVIMPFRKELESTFQTIKKVCEGAPLNMKIVRGDTIYKDGLIINQIYEEIVKSDIVFADVSGSNPNVFYEVGYSHALNKRTILLIKKEYKDKFPFDTAGFRHLVYENDKHLSEELTKYLNYFSSIDFNSQDSTVKEMEYFESYTNSLKNYILTEYGDNDFKLFATNLENDFTIIKFKNPFNEKIVFKIDRNGIVLKSTKIEN